MTMSKTPLAGSDLTDLEKRILALPEDWDSEENLNQLSDEDLDRMLISKEQAEELSHHLNGSSITLRGSKGRKKTNHLNVLLTAKPAPSRLPTSAESTTGKPGNSKDARLRSRKNAGR